jgi:rubrerythrin
MIGPDDNQYINHNENEYIAYLHAFIEKVIFKREDINKIIEKTNNDYEAIKYAIIKEEESIRFYENIKHFTAKSYNAIIDLIISEENLHISDLLSLKENLL